MLQGKEAGIAMLLISDGPVRDRITGRDVRNAGMGIVVSSSHVLTCSHVVNTAIGEDALQDRKPDRKVRVVFPLSEYNQAVDGKVVCWQAPAKQPVGDIAVIKLDQDVPSDVGVATFARFSQSLDGDSLMIFGYRAGSDEGNYVEREIHGHYAPRKGSDRRRECQWHVHSRWLQWGISLECE